MPLNRQRSQHEFEDSSYGKRLSNSPLLRTSSLHPRRKCDRVTSPVEWDCKYSENVCNVPRVESSTDPRRGTSHALRPPSQMIISTRTGVVYGRGYARVGPSSERCLSSDGLGRGVWRRWRPSDAVRWSYLVGGSCRLVSIQMHRSLLPSRRCPSIRERHSIPTALSPAERHVCYAFRCSSVATDSVCLSCDPSFDPRRTPSATTVTQIARRRVRASCLLSS